VRYPKGVRVCREDGDVLVSEDDLRTLDGSRRLEHTPESQGRPTVWAIVFVTMLLFVAWWLLSK
jgi:hypothetical protein